MTTLMPNAVDSYSTRNTGDTIEASHVGDLQDAMVQVERVVVGSPVQNMLFHGAVKDTDSGAAHIANVNAWTAAVAALPSNGGCIYFPPGTYFVGAAGLTYTSTKPCNIIGAGMNVTILRKGSGTNGQILTIGNGSTAGINSVVIQDMRFTGTNSALTTGSNIKFNGVTYCGMFNVHSAQAAEHGLWITNGDTLNAYLKFVGCVITHNLQHGVTITDTGSGAQAAMWFTACTINSNGTSGQDYHGLNMDTANEVTLASCNISENLGAGIYSYNTGYLGISACQIVGNYRRALVLDIGYASQITGNTIYSNNQGSSSMSPECAVLFTGSGCENNTFTGNVVIEPYNNQTLDYGVREESSATGNIFTGNIIRGQNGATITTPLSLANTSSTSVHGNNLLWSDASTAVAGARYDSAPASIAATTNITGGAYTIYTTGVDTFAFTLGSGAQTGAILEAGVYPRQRITLINTDATDSLTFAAAGTSNVSTGTSCVVAALSAMTLVWYPSTSRWYPV